MLLCFPILLIHSGYFFFMIFISRFSLNFIGDIKLPLIDFEIISQGAKIKIVYIYIAKMFWENIYTLETAVT